MVSAIVDAIGTGLVIAAVAADFIFLGICVYLIGD